jgi:hypothetical protein
MDTPFMQTTCYGTISRNINTIINYSPEIYTARGGNGVRNRGTAALRS